MTARELDDAGAVLEHTRIRARDEFATAMICGFAAAAVLTITPPDEAALAGPAVSPDPDRNVPCAHAQQLDHIARGHERIRDDAAVEQRDRGDRLAVHDREQHGPLERPRIIERGQAPDGLGLVALRDPQRDRRGERVERPSTKH